MFVSMFEWAREKKQWILFWFIVALVGTLGFGVGYFTAREVSPAPIVIEQCSRCP